MSIKVIICPSCKTGNRPSYKQCTTCGRSFIDEKNSSNRSKSKNYKKEKENFDLSLHDFNIMKILNMR